MTVDTRARPETVGAWSLQRRGLVRTVAINPDGIWISRKHLSRSKSRQAVQLISDGDGPAASVDESPSHILFSQVQQLHVSHQALQIETGEGVIVLRGWPYGSSTKRSRMTIAGSEVESRVIIASFDAGALIARAARLQQTGFGHYESRRQESITRPPADDAMRLRAMTGTMTAVATACLGVLFLLLVDGIMSLGYGLAILAVGFSIAPGSVSIGPEGIKMRRRFRGQLLEWSDIDSVRAGDPKAEEDLRRGLLVVMKDGSETKSSVIRSATRTEQQRFVELARHYSQTHGIESRLSVAQLRNGLG